MKRASLRIGSTTDTIGGATVSLCAELESWRTEPNLAGVAYDATGDHDATGDRLIAQHRTQHGPNGLVIGTIVCQIRDTLG